MELALSYTQFADIYKEVYGHTRSVNLLWRRMREQGFDEFTQTDWNKSNMVGGPKPVKQFIDAVITANKMELIKRISEM